MFSCDWDGNSYISQNLVRIHKAVLWVHSTVHCNVDMENFTLILLYQISIFQMSVNTILLMELKGQNSTLMAVEHLNNLQPTNCSYL